MSLLLRSGGFMPTTNYLVIFTTLYYTALHFTALHCTESTSVKKEAVEISVLLSAHIERVCVSHMQDF